MKVDYTIRPAKNIERKMMCEAFRRLSSFQVLSRYRYVGFGSATFNDFILIHRQLDIADMVSIERDTNSRRRYDFNRPYHCIQIEYGESVDVLPRLDWKKASIVWLDHESRLTDDVLADVECVAANVKPNSFFAVSFNVVPVADKKDALSDLQERVGAEHVPMGLKPSDLKGWLAADVDCRVITNKILETLRARNAEAQADDRILFQQVFNFRYADDAEMATFGGVFYRAKDSALLSQCQFDSLEFTRLGPEAGTYHIDAPILTYRELRYLDGSLPGGHSKLKQDKIIPWSDVEKYRRVYRYFPVFAETEI